MTLARKFTLIFVTLSLFTVALIGILAFTNAEDYLERETRNHVETVNTLKSSQFDLWINTNSASLGRISKRPLVIQATDILVTNDVGSDAYRNAYEDLYETHLLQLIDDGLGFSELFILHPETGRVLVASHPNYVGTFRENEDYFIEGKNELFIQNPYYLLSEQRQVITIATPLISANGQVVGILAGHLNLDVATEIMQTGFLDHDTGDTFIVNKFNFYVTDSRFASSNNANRTVQTDGVNACLDGQTDTNIYQNTQGVTVLGAYLWIPDYELCMLTEVNQSEAYESINSLRDNISIASAVVLLVGTGIGLFFSRSIILPINQLVLDTKIIGQGDLTHRVTTHRKDEIGELGRAFDQMITSLNDITASRDELNNEIAQRMLTEHILSEREVILKVSLEAAGAGTWIWDIIEQEVHWDEASENIYGLAPGTFGGTYTDWRKSVHPDDINLIEQEIAKAVKGEKLFDIEFRILLPGDGQMIRYVLAQGILHKNDAGDPVRMIGVHIDVTERKLNEEALYILTNSLSERVKELSGLYDVSAYEYQGLEINDYLKKICERLPASMQYPTDGMMDIVYFNQHYGDREASDFPTKLSFPIKVNNLKTGKLIFAYTKEHEFLSEESLHLAEVARRIGLYIHNRNNYDVMHNTLQELASSNRELQQFAYVASHDLQEPLRMVSSYLQLLQRRYEGKLDDKADQYIYFAVDGANRMKILINDLLTYSRLKTQVQPFKRHAMMRSVNACLANLDTTIKEKNARITIDGELPELSVDETQMIQLWQNLISNSLKYQAADTTPEVIIRAEEKETAWQFSVQDNGIGIESEFYDQIFVIFKRLHNRAQYDGTGIGLAVCRRIVERHMGAIWVESALGEGSTFYFTIAKNLDSPQQSHSDDESSILPVNTEFLTEL